ncbi:MAG: hypothetical protein ACK4UN_05050 [Limisphaerales bacterium]
MMNPIIICPADRPKVAHLAELQPLAVLSICGKPFIYYWIDFFVDKGARHITILAADRPEVVRQVVGDGARWGVSIEVLPVRQEPTVEEVREQCCRESASFVCAPSDVFLADYLPQLPERRCFDSYAEFFTMLRENMSLAYSKDRIGIREIAPRVWAGLHTHIPPSARLIAPCWIADKVSVGDGAEIGPNAVIESQTVISPDSTISNSHVAENTFVGPRIEVESSIAVGDTLINWKNNSTLRINDPLLLKSLQELRSIKTQPSWAGRIAAFLCIVLTAPLAFLWTLLSHLRAQTAIREMQAVNPYPSNPSEETIIYYEFANCTGLWQRWPQLWNIVFGEFRWVGNRPISKTEAEQLSNEYEKLWLRAPVGLISQADAEACFERYCDESKVHASYYTAHETRLLNARILWKVLVGCGKRNATATIPVGTPKLETEGVRVGKTAWR